MKKATHKQRKTLVLHRESLVRLDDGALSSVEGGTNEETISCTRPDRPPV